MTVKGGFLKRSEDLGARVGVELLPEYWLVHPKVDELGPMKRATLARARAALRLKRKTK